MFLRARGVGALALAGASVVSLQAASSQDSELFSNAPTRVDDGLPQQLNLTLRQVVVVCRHGDRTPIRALGCEDAARQQRDLWRALVPSKSEGAKWDEVLPVYDKATCEVARVNSRHRPPYGQLTLLGVVEARRLGYTLRERYVELHKLLPETVLDTGGLGQHMFHFRTTNYQRTRQTLQNVLMGLYPELVELEPSGAGKLWTVDDDSETMYPNTNTCCRQGEILRSYRSRIRQDHDTRAEVIALQRRLRKVLGLLPSSRLPGWSSLSEVLICQKRYRLPFSPSVSLEDVKLICNLKNESWSSWARVGEMQKLAVGTMLKEIVAHMQPVATGAGKEKRKLVVYSGHDSTLVPLLHAFDAFNDWPTYASNFILELWRDEERNEAYVRVLFNGAEMPVFGDALCKWDKFVAEAQRLIPESFDEECVCNVAKERDMRLGGM